MSRADLQVVAYLGVVLGTTALTLGAWLLRTPRGSETATRSGVIPTMSIGKALLPEFDEEMQVTRRLLERVPSDKGEWKPHPKSFALGHLAQLVSWMPGWIATTLRDTSLDLARGSGYSMETTTKLLEGFDASVAATRTALAAATDSDFDVPWSLQRGGQVLFTAPRGRVVRQHINHLVHHRGQLTVYLRLLDVPIPSIYGPTADEKW